MLMLKNTVQGSFMSPNNVSVAFGGKTKAYI